MDSLKLGVPQTELKIFEDFLKTNKIDYKEVSDSEKHYLPPEIVTLSLGISQLAVSVLIAYLNSRKKEDATKIVIINSDGTTLILNSQNVKNIRKKGAKKIK